jgi:phage tail sheath protein FI
MATYIAPGVYVEVQDNSAYAAPISITTCGVVGAATKGPVLGKYEPDNNTFNIPVLCTTQQEFVTTFGQPSPEYQAPYAALLYLQQGRQLFFGRVVGSGSATASKVFSSVLAVHAMSAGDWGNDISIAISDSFINGAKMVTVYQLVGNQMITEETYDGLITDPASDRFYDSVINGTSQFLTVTYNQLNTIQPTNTTGDNPAVGNMEALKNGNDGAPPHDNDIIGTVQSGYATGLWAYADIDTVDVSLLSAPGYTSPAVVTAISSIVNVRGDCLGVIHGPQGLNAPEIVDWHNAAGAFKPSGSTPSVLVNNARMALYWPWVQVYDSYNAQNVWVPPVGFALQAVAYNDQVGEPWYAPAGINRARCSSALALEYRPTLGDREFIYGPGNGNAVNPLVDLPLDGITIYGQRTMQRFPSALDRINVMRLIFYSAKVLAGATRVLVFEQNDQILWNQFKAIVAPYMADIRSRRGVEAYKIICDETTNTPYRRNNNEMYGVIMLIPTKSAEKIIIQFSVNASGADLSAPQLG